MESRSYVAILTLAMMTVLTAATEEDLCRILDFKPRISGHALKGHVIKNLTLEQPGSCQTSCYLESDCVSYNLGPEEDGKYVCELSDSDSTTHDDDLVPREGFVYRGTQNACSSNACSPHGKCQNGFTEKKYRCECEEGYTGETCDQLQENWKKINTDPVCFRAKGDKYGSFKVQTTGSMIALKLVHMTGSLECLNRPGNFWGCDHVDFGNKKLMTLITYSNKTILLPVEYVSGLGSKCRSIDYSYGLEGVDVNAEELRFPPFSSPVHVSHDQEFQIWYGQDLADCTEGNNSGEACVDVYIWYN